jgi:hypothetical protein
MALNVLKKLILPMLLLKLAWTQEKLVNSEASIDKSLDDLKTFCSNKNSYLLTGIKANFLKKTLHNICLCKRDFQHIYFQKYFQINRKINLQKFSV